MANIMGNIMGIKRGIKRGINRNLLREKPDDVGGGLLQLLEAIAITHPPMSLFNF